MECDEDAPLLAHEVEEASSVFEVDKQKIQEHTPEKHVAAALMLEKDLCKMRDLFLSIEKQFLASLPVKMMFQELSKMVMCRKTRDKSGGVPGNSLIQEGAPRLGDPLGCGVSCSALGAQSTRTLRTPPLLLKLRSGLRAGRWGGRRLVPAACDLRACRRGVRVAGLACLQRAPRSGHHGERSLDVRVLA